MDARILLKKKGSNTTNNNTDNTTTPQLVDVRGISPLLTRLTERETHSIVSLPELGHAHSEAVTRKWLATRQVYLSNINQ